MLYARCCVYALDIIVLFGLHNCPDVKRVHPGLRDLHSNTHPLRGRTQSDNMPCAKVYPCATVLLLFLQTWTGLFYPEYLAQCPGFGRGLARVYSVNMRVVTTRCSTTLSVPEEANTSESGVGPKHLVNGLCQIGGVDAKWKRPDH